MKFNEAFILLFTHGIPILFFAFMATDVLLRNKKKVEHVLLSLISCCYLLLFAEEYIRNQVSIEHSPILSALWLSSVGIAITSLCFHFLIKFTRLHAKMPRYLYPYIFYLPLLFVFFNIATNAQWISAQQFVQTGMWKMPVYNDGYYAAMAGSIVTDLLFMIPLMIARSKSDTPEQRSIYNQLVFGIMVAVVWHVLFGFIDYGDSLPPYPYLYGGIIWCYFLRRTMKKHDFLSLNDKRYEKLFNLNPDAIVLVDSTGTAKDVNPGAKRLLDAIQLNHIQFLELLDPEIKKRIRSRLEIRHYETEIVHGSKRLALLVNVDYVWVDNELHILLIARDITVQKEYQEQIEFWAYHDPLTRLPNRRFFYEKLDEALQESERNRETLALLLIDLDNLKVLNDTRGHLAGDDALRQAADIIKETVEDRGAAARMGGDEFILFIGSSPSAQEIQQMLGQMQHKFARRMAKYGTIPIGLSIGVSFYPADAAEGQALINIADNAMFEMKRSRA